MPLKFEKPVVHEVSLVCEFERVPDMRLNSKEVETLLKPLVGLPATATNVADEDNPTKPRFIFPDPQNGKMLVVSQVQSNMIFRFEDPHLDYKELMGISEEIDKFSDAFIELAGKSKIENLGLVVTTQLNVDLATRSEELHKHIFSKFYSLETFSEIVEAKARFGFRDENGINHIVNVSDFEIRDVKSAELQQRAAQRKSITIKLTDYPVSEKGIEVVADVNFRHALQSDENVKLSFSALLNNSVNTLDKYINEVSN